MIATYMIPSVDLMVWDCEKPIEIKTNTLWSIVVHVRLTLRSGIILVVFSCGNAKTLRT